MSREIVLWLSRNMQNILQTIHPTTSWLDFKKWALSILPLFSFGQTVSAVWINPLQLHCQSGLPWASATSSVQGRAAVGDRRGFLMGLLIVLLTFLPLCLLLIWVAVSVCVEPLPFHEIQSSAGERSVCVQVFYSLPRICCSRCCASFFLRSYVLIV